MLTAAAQSRLTVVTGLPGAGKTTALATWAHNRPEGSTGWLSLEAADNHPARFWTRLAAAVGLPGPSDRGEAAGPEGLMCGEAVPVPVLIVDEFQVISNRRLVDTFGSLVSSTSFPVPVVIGSRWAPDLRLHRLRLSGELAEIDSDDLGFSVDETRALLRMFRGDAAADADAVALTERTEGWAAGLGLVAHAPAAMSPEGAFARGASDVFDPMATYFAREVVDLLSPEEERFLLDTSVLERLSGSLCQALTDRADAHLMLAALADRNLFLFRLDRHGLDGKGQWFRHHRLFREFLRSRLLLEDPSRARRALLRAAAWHGRSGDEATALRHFVEAAACRGVPVLAASGSGSSPPSHRASPSGPVPSSADGPAADPEHLYRLARALLHAGRLADGVRWLRRLETEAAASLAGPAWRGPIEGLWAVHASLRGDAAGVLLHCAEARRIRRRGPVEPARSCGDSPAHGPCHPLDPTLPGQLAALAGRAHLWLDRPEKARAVLARHFPAGNIERDDPARDGVLALLAGRTGQLQEAWMLASRAVELASKQDPSPWPVILDGLLARTIVLWERHELDAAARLAIPTAGDHPDLTCFWPLEYQQIQVMIARGHATDAMSRLGRLRAVLADLGSRGSVGTRLDVLEIRCREALGDHDPALLALLESPLGRYPTEVLAWVDLCAGQPEQAVARLTSPRDQPTSVGAQLQRLTLLARARVQLGDEREALVTVRRALDLGQPGGYVTAFVEDAPELVSLLRRIAGPFPEAYLARVVEHAERTHVRGGGARPDPVVEPLSGREQEILTHLPSHRSQGQIAAEMYVSINTVKTHIRAVYRKLGVSSRSEAVSVARARQLI
jgi:LuxR family maltose regulon positive regulatory protein